MPPPAVQQQQHMPPVGQFQQGPPQGFQPQPGAVLPGPPSMGAPNGFAPPPPQLQQQPLAAAPAQPKPDWTEHKAPDGRPYWYNAKTKTSKWDKPPELMTPEERAKAQTTDWKEHTAPDGRKYYYNKTTKESKWTPPEEWKRAQAGKAAAAAAASPAAAAKPVVPVVQVVKAEATASPAQAVPSQQPVQAVPEPKSDPEGKYLYATKEDAKLAFKQLLASVGMRSDWSWEQAMRLIVSDPRYGALKSLGEKKACFNEYAQQRKNEEKDEARQKLKRSREEFVRMLEGSDDRSLTRFSRARELFEDDPRWKAVTNTEREELWQDFLRDREKREREAKRAKRRERAAAFRDLLLSTPAIKVDTPWRKAVTKLEGDPAYEALDKIDRLEVFQDYIKDLVAKEAAEAERRKEERRRKERKNRDAFTALLREHLADGRLTAKMRWKDYVDNLKEEETYKAVEKNLSGSRPRELFEDIIEDAEKDFEKDRALLKDLVKSHDIEVGQETAYEAFLGALDATDSQPAAKVPDANKRLVFDELVGKAAERAAKEAKRAARAAEAFTALLRETKAITAEMPWEEAHVLIASDRDYQAVPEEKRVELYQGHQAYLADKAARDAEKEKRREAEKAERAAKRKKSGEESDEETGERHKDHKRHKKSKHRDGSSERERKEKKHKSRKRDSEDGEKKSKSHKHDKKDKDVPKEEAETVEEGEGSEEGEL